MSPNAEQHAFLIFVVVFGTAAIWFGLYITWVRRTNGKPYHLGEGRIMGALFAAPTIAFVAIVLSFWH